MKSRKKIFIFAYTRKNLGDDLFIKILTDRYENVDFTISIVNPNHIGDLKSIKNLEITTSDLNIKNIDIKKFDAFICIGGSIFTGKKEHTDYQRELLKFIVNAKSLGKPFFYIGCNYPSEFDLEFYETTKKIFKKCDSICFRDTHSSKLFSDIENAKYAPDVIFTFPAPKVEKIKNSLGISLINLDKDFRKELRNKEKEYMNLLLASARDFIKNKGIVYLFSFCAHEGDSQAIDLLYEGFTHEEKTNVKKIYYNDDLNEFINAFGQMERMICTRFHSMILSILFEQKIYVLSYNNKISNVINDFTEKINYLDLNTNFKKSIISKNDFCGFDNNFKPDLVNASQKMFEALDKYIFNY